ncbi:putative disease resistance protein At3g15700 isoform X1 [Lolium rigidum]|uniref:putative disease resistance protein At3g15700 isoform X1 n=1 Tax=Lolium rigidum TaxID=89674 RepID=UPI001F5DC827|nr:putative disease resistance protein At3g15700 isoform X1 [Lolium rigidum]
MPVYEFFKTIMWHCGSEYAHYLWCAFCILLCILLLLQEQASPLALSHRMKSLKSNVAFCFVEGFATIIEIIIVLWDFGARLVTRSETPNLARQMVPQHVGVWGMDSFKSKAHDFLESKLLDDSTLGLWGTSGVGKTRFLFLMIECYANGDSLFRHILPIQDGSVTDMQHCLAILLKLDWDTMSLFEEHHRAKIISEYLKHDSFLVLLDDVQDKPLDLASFGLPMPLGGRRKLIVTSRSQVGCSRAGCTVANTIEMKGLDDEDAWNLFKYNAGVEITEADVEVHKIAKEMVSACEGMPRAISAIGLGMAGSTLCGTNLDDWSYAYELFKAKNLPPERMEEIWAVLV